MACDISLNGNLTVTWYSHDVLVESENGGEWNTKPFRVLPVDVSLKKKKEKKKDQMHLRSPIAFFYPTNVPAHECRFPVSRQKQDFLFLQE